jgi:hypothetical protein
VGVVSNFLDDGVISLIWVIFRDVYCFPNTMIGGEVFFPLFLKFFWKITSLFGDYVG